MQNQTDTIQDLTTVETIISTQNTLEEVALRATVKDMNWTEVSLSGTELTDKMVAIVSVTSQQMTNAALSAALSRFAPARVVLVVPSMANFFLFLQCPPSVVSIIQRDCELEQFRTTLEFIGHGHTLLPWGQSENQPCASHTPAPETVQQEWSLTNRELEISREIAYGRSNKEIARQLGIAANTVDVHVSAIRRKLGVHNRTQIAVKIVEKLGQNASQQLTA